MLALIAMLASVYRPLVVVNYTSLMKTDYFNLWDKVCWSNGSLFIDLKKVCIKSVSLKRILPPFTPTKETFHSMMTIL